MSAHNPTLTLSLRLRRTGLALTRFPSRLLALSALSRSRRSVARLDDHLLRDIGITRAEAMAEASRPAWDAPSHWMG